MMKKEVNKMEIIQIGKAIGTDPYLIALNERMGRSYAPRVAYRTATGGYTVSVFPNAR